MDNRDKTEYVEFLKQDHHIHQDPQTTTFAKISSPAFECPAGTPGPPEAAGPDEEPGQADQDRQPGSAGLSGTAKVLSSRFKRSWFGKLRKSHSKDFSVSTEYGTEGEDEYTVRGGGGDGYKTGPPGPPRPDVSPGMPGPDGQAGGAPPPEPPGPPVAPGNDKKPGATEQDGQSEEPGTSIINSPGVPGPAKPLVSPGQPGHYERSGVAPAGPPGNNGQP
ncbi:hypothetical protein L3Y34_012938 [Caenorhabditis briggsae]|uniref:Uncharacterized protein n=1 Tax=Caenorhabditis briggsae TaxID=6238 RepID=A0AAE9CX93_CAEBR|nr:hypothetical protein L3Y34_012938 [Caenorhabditis briggsae]